MVDAVEYTNEYFNKGKELDEQINVNKDLITERITYESNDKEIIKYQKILIYKRVKDGNK